MVAPFGLMDVRIALLAALVTVALSGCLGGQGLDLQEFDDPHYVTVFVQSDLSAPRTVAVAVYDGEEVVAAKQHEAPGDGLHRDPILSVSILPASFRATVEVDGEPLPDIAFVGMEGCRFNEMFIDIVLDDETASAQSRCV